ncbi:hypothetical protein GCM10022251_81360 [Phytohabitans flavus]|uniref:Aminoglycoside phosphotransferase domain-containing protein n=1 Tax=Phytohabitans flavus TaxID=1076124 RepID=A0A6F8XLC2_9ACTN|nr:phosphotransferase [Phytohabitans flavus]BCB74607.1 hypothetical protein Pflav_010170 [Phytohabitans flavus]
MITLTDGAYCVLPWIDGHHPTGPNLTVWQAQHLGTVIGQIHRTLNDPDTPADLPPVGQPPAARVIQPDHALAEAERFRTAAAAAHAAFDREVIELLEQRIQLIDKHAHERPTSDEPAGPYGWTHGDLQHRNIIWTDHTINAVIDWDRHPRPPLRRRNRPHHHRSLLTQLITEAELG